MTLLEQLSALFMPFIAGGLWACAANLASINTTLKKLVPPCTTR